MSSRLFENNQGLGERIARVVVGTGLLSLVFMGPETLWGMVGIIPLATGLIGSCPMYTLIRGKTPKAEAGTQR